MKQDPQDVRSALQDVAFDEIERLADRTASYARSTGEAAYRGDTTTVGVHLRQMRECVISMIKVFKVTFDEGMAEGRRPLADREDQRRVDGEP